MLHCFLIRVLRMAGRAGKDMLETVDSDDEASLLAASDADLTEEQTQSNKLARTLAYHDGTTNLETLPCAPSPDLGINIATLLDQPPHKKRPRRLSGTPKLTSCSAPQNWP